MINTSWFTNEVPFIKFSQFLFACLFVNKLFSLKQLIIMQNNTILFRPCTIFFHLLFPKDHCYHHFLSKHFKWWLNNTVNICSETATPQSTWCWLEFISRKIGCMTNKLLLARVKTKPQKSPTVLYISSFNTHPASFNKSTWHWTISRTKCGHKFAFCQVWNVEIWAWAASVFTV